MKQLLLLGICVFLGYVSAYAQPATKHAKSWEKGWFEIHHINTKLGNATYFIFPDGTTLLYDAGELPWTTFSTEKQDEYCLLPTDTLSTGKKIVEYIKQVSPDSVCTGIDYAVVSHFHDDHYGSFTPERSASDSGDYYLSGITEVYEYLPFGCLIDRGFPRYDYPVDLSGYYRNNKSFCNYIRFINAVSRNGRTKVESLETGSTRQIKMKSENHVPFKVCNLKKNLEYWSNDTQEILHFDESPLLKDGKFNENPLSIALLFSFGNFKYYIGGDISGVTDWPDVDLETPFAPVIGQVDAMSLHHHGYKDASNLFFLQTLNPTVIVQPSLHVPHFQPNVLANLREQGGDVFALNYPDNVPQAIRGLIALTHRDYNAHVVIRVAPGGEMFYIDTYEPYVDSLKLKHTFGPYYSTPKK